MWVLFKTRWGLEPCGRDQKLIIPLHFVSSHGLSSEGTSFCPFHLVLFHWLASEGTSFCPFHLVLFHWLASEGTSFCPIHLVLFHWLSSEGTSFCPFHLVLFHWLSSEGTRCNFLSFSVSSLTVLRRLKSLCPLFNVTSLAVLWRDKLLLVSSQWLSSEGTNYF